LEAIYFNKENTYGKGHPVSTDYFIKPDMVICENGIGRPRCELLSYVGYQDKGSEQKVSLGNEHIPHANTRFALIHNDIHSPILAVGSALNCHPSSLQKGESVAITWHITWKLPSSQQ